MGRINYHSPSPKKQPQRDGNTNRSLLEIELALAKAFDWRRNLVVFNAIGTSMRLNIQHECDMLVMTRAGYLTEIEIKRTWEDFCADFKKGHHHESHGCDIREFWYCVPEGIFPSCLRKLTEEKTLPTGILTYDEQLQFLHKHTCPSFRDDELTMYLNAEKKYGRYVLGFKEADEDPEVKLLYTESAKPLFLEQQFELARLGAMRQITLREKIAKAETSAKEPDAGLIEEITNLKTILRQYREIFEQETGYKLDTL